MKHVEMKMAVTYLQMKGFKFDFEKGLAVKNGIVIAMQSIEFKTFKELDKYVFLADNGFVYAPDRKIFHSNGVIFFTQEFVEQTNVSILKLTYAGMIDGVTKQ